MKSLLYTIFALIIASLVPGKSFAAEPVDNGNEFEQDNITALTANIEDPTTAFLNLDAEAIEEAGLATDELVEQIIDYAHNYMGRPYVYGAKGPRAFDCSGFTSYVFRNFDIDLSPSSRTQFTQGEKVDRQDIRPGDLLFFSGRGGGKTVGHVALAIDVDQNGSVKFIHAATKRGISHDAFPDNAYYAKRFLGARRVVAE